MAKNSNRDEFSDTTKRKIERQARGHCSRPQCRRLTHAARSDGTGEINIGVASHICAAARGGPRYDEMMLPEQRSSADNGIWLCQDHAHAVDSKDSIFTVKELREWKRQSDEDSWRSVMDNIPYGPGMKEPTGNDLRERLRQAAATDLEVFRRTTKWPGSTVQLTLKVRHLSDSLSTGALARAVTTLDDLILVAPPGMGKTTTLFQIAEGVLESGSGVPLFVSLGDWATDQDGLLTSVLNRAAFAAVSEEQLRTAAAAPGVVLLLDGWNELDAAARERARVQLTALKAELPELGVLVSTRRQAMDIPFSGTPVELLPLNDAQRLQIATALRGEAGARLLEEAWRTPGVRELVAIPLYLRVLLSLPEGDPFPGTKEEVLRRFVEAHERDAGHAAALFAVTSGFQRHYMESLAVNATRTANTTLADAIARRTVSGTMRTLQRDGQITIIVQPDAVLNALVSNHVLVRTGEVPGFSFQHQQFQEWYASHHVEGLIMEALSDGSARERLKTEILDRRHWEEAILFAVERTSRGDAAMQSATGAAILAALDVDPMLAADMIFCATNGVWETVKGRIQAFIAAWHTPGKVDRAVNFMITSGRPEFRDLVWPLVTNGNDQVQLSALRLGRRFRPSVLGPELAPRIAALPTRTRKILLQEMADYSGLDGLDLATAIAKADPDPMVRASLVDVLLFRDAEGYIAGLLSDTEDPAYDILAKNGHADDVSISVVQEGLGAARRRLGTETVSARDRLWSMLRAHRPPADEGEIASLIADMEIDEKKDDALSLLFEIDRLHPCALAEGLLRRVREDRTLFYGAVEMLSGAEYALEDEGLLAIALGEGSVRDLRVAAAASMLGPGAAAIVLDEFIAISRRTRNSDGSRDKVAIDRYYELRNRIAHLPKSSLVAAVQSRSAGADNHSMEELAGRLSRDSLNDTSRTRRFTAADTATVSALAQEWGERLVAAGNATRSQMASIAKLIGSAPSPSLLGILKALLDSELRQYREVREQAQALGWRQCEATNEARVLYDRDYQRAFTAIRSPETTRLLINYLPDEYFGHCAAVALALQWEEEHRPKEDQTRMGRVDFSGVADRRAARAEAPNATSREGEAIIAVIDALLVDGAPPAQIRRAVALGAIAARLPHGRREATFSKLVALGERRGRAELVQSLVLNGWEVDIGIVKEGIEETVDAFKDNLWGLINNDSYEIRDWLSLLPFSSSFADLPAVIRGLPKDLATPDMVRELVNNLRHAPSAAAEDVLFKLAEDMPKLYASSDWLSAVFGLKTATAAHRMIELCAAGTLQQVGRDNEWLLERELREMMRKYPDVLARIGLLLRDGVASAPLFLLARSLAEQPTVEGVMILVEYERRTGKSILGGRGIEQAVTEKVPSEQWKDSYEVFPVAVTELRRRLLASAQGRDRKDPAVRCLDAIDQIRDEHGSPEDEPRHPDLASGYAWPIIGQLGALEMRLT